jgi:hypothetical protein
MPARATVTFEPRPVRPGHDRRGQLVERDDRAEIGLDLRERVLVEAGPRPGDAVADHDHVHVAVVAVADRGLDAEVGVAAGDDDLLDAEHPQLGVERSLEEHRRPVLLDHQVLRPHRLGDLVDEVDLPGAPQARRPVLLVDVRRDPPAAPRDVLRIVDLLREEHGHLPLAGELDQPEEARDDRPLVLGTDPGLLHLALGVAEALLHVDHEQRGAGGIDVGLGHRVNLSSSVLGA